MYKLMSVGGWNGIKHLDDDLVIPIDEANRHYQEYLAWVAAGNTPEPADPDPLFNKQIQEISRAQCAEEMFHRGMITSGEALAMAKDGTMPSMVDQLLQGMVAKGNMTDDEANLLRLSFAKTNYQITNPVLNAFMKATGATDADIAAFFNSAGAR